MKPCSLPKMGLTKTGTISPATAPASVPIKFVAQQTRLTGTLGPETTTAEADKIAPSANHAVVPRHTDKEKDGTAAQTGEQLTHAKLQQINFEPPPGKKGPVPEKKLGRSGPPYPLRPFGNPDTPTPWFPWLTYVPLELRQWLAWRPQAIGGDQCLLLLYTGEDDDEALDSCIHAAGLLPRKSVWAIDLCRHHSQNILHQDLYDSLCSWALAGGLLGVIGGPMCRTWSIRRHIYKPGAPRPVRGRQGTHAWGLPGLTQEEKTIVEGDSILLLDNYISAV